jgi:hypothetical protein
MTTRREYTPQQDAAFAEYLAAQEALTAARDRFHAACLALYAANHPEDPDAVARRQS